MPHYEILKVLSDSLLASYLTIHLYTKEENMGCVIKLMGCVSGEKKICLVKSEDFSSIEYNHDCWWVLGLVCTSILIQMKFKKTPLLASPTIHCLSNIML